MDLGVKDGIAACNAAEGELYLAQGKFSEASVALALAEKAFVEIADKVSLVNVYRTAGKTYAKQLDYAKAITSFEKASALAAEMNMNKGISDLCKSLSDAYLATGNNAMAESFQKKYEASLEQEKQSGALAAEARKLQAQ
jgi:tetratricopeptide (TPR) repeat protein